MQQPKGKLDYQNGEKSILQLIRTLCIIFLDI